MNAARYVVGIGMSGAATSGDVERLVAGTLRQAGIAPGEVLLVATHDRLTGDPRVTGLGLPVVGFSSERLSGVVVPTPSDAVRSAVGTASVAEAAALLGAAPGAHLVVAKQQSSRVTAAVARSGGKPS